MLPAGHVHLVSTCPKPQVLSESVAPGVYQVWSQEGFGHKHSQVGVRTTSLLIHSRLLVSCLQRSAQASPAHLYWRSCASALLHPLDAPQIAARVGGACCKG